MVPGRQSVGLTGPAMTVQQTQATGRYQAIAEWLATEGRVDVAAIASRLGVAQETIRRDLRSMEAAGKLQRVHGGAVRLDAGPLSVRAASSPDSAREDSYLAARVWEQLPRTGTVLLGTGHLSLALAHTIVASPPDKLGLTIVTNSLDAAIVLSRASRLDVYNIGGTVSPVTRGQEGDWAVHEMERLHVDVAVICPCGISAEHGLTQATPGAAAISQVEVASGERVIALADAAALGASAFVQFARLDEIDLVAISGSPTPAALQPLLDFGTAVDVA
jgi:DeoR family fructose operon transcriptional repressor